MIQYEVVEFYHGECCSSCGKFDNLHDAIERKTILDIQKEDMNEYFEIIVRLPNKTTKENRVVEDFLSAKTLVTEEIVYVGDEDGNLQLIQNSNSILMTPKQCLDLRELLSAHLDVLNMKRSVS